MEVLLFLEYLNNCKFLHFHWVLLLLLIFWLVKRACHSIVRYCVYIFLVLLVEVQCPILVRNGIGRA